MCYVLYVVYGYGSSGHFFTAIGQRLATRTLLVMFFLIRDNEFMRVIGLNVLVV